MIYKCEDGPADAQAWIQDQEEETVKCHECGKAVSSCYWVADDIAPEAATYCNDCIHDQINKAFEILNPDFAALLEDAVMNEMRLF